MSPERNFLQFAPFNFDVSYHEIFAALCLGGSLFIVPEDSRLDLAKLSQLFAKNPIHKAILPVTLLQQLIETYSEETYLFANLREIISAGEQLQITPAMISAFKKLEHCTLYNFYGPTEADIVTSYTFDPNPELWPKYIPIGKPAINVQVYILNSHLQPVPIGVTGELYVAGGGLARGYFNNPQLTKEKFIANPFSDNSLLYKTGDLARYLPKGDIEYLGRIDDVVKVRGYRIELGEVETILNQHPQIAQAIATVQGETAREKYLAAYFIPRPGETVNQVELRHFLENWLPDYMIPSAFVVMESFQLSPNGKVDRKVLPIPDKNPLSLTQNYVAPRTAIEEVLAVIWAEILEVERVGIEDDFFLLGGHSLKAIQLISKIRQTLEIEVSVRQLFNHSTISQLTQVMIELVGNEGLLNEIAVTVQEISRLSPEEVQALLSQN
jgi:acyl-coenzyme A synthetase/AMP-(fatty) acid ligase/acyl carrier protein